MKKIYFFAVISAALAFTACSIEKRHYMKGYHVTWNHNSHNDQNANEPAAAVVTTTTPAVTETVTPAPTENPQQAPVVAPAVNEQSQAAQVKSEVNNPVVVAPAITEEKVVEQAKQSKHVLKQAVKHNNAPAADDTNKILLVILAILLPPVAMYLYEGSWTGRCWVNLLLTLLCGLPGMIHALVIICGDK